MDTSCLVLTAVGKPRLWPLAPFPSVSCTGPDPRLCGQINNLYFLFTLHLVLEPPCSVRDCKKVHPAPPLHWMLQPVLIGKLPFAASQ